MQEERPGESDLLEGCLNELSGWLWDGYEECSQEQNCGALIEQAQPMAMVMRFAELAKGQVSSNVNSSSRQWTVLDRCC